MTSHRPPRILASIIFVIGALLAVLGIYLAALGGSLTFFLVTNFAWWPFYTTLYPHTLGGLLQSYTMALPFYKNSLISDMLFSAVLFGGFEMAKVYLPQGKKELATN